MSNRERGSGGGWREAAGDTHSHVSESVSALTIRKKVLIWDAGGAVTLRGLAGAFFIK